MIGENRRWKSWYSLHSLFHQLDRCFASRFDITSERIRRPKSWWINNGRRTWKEPRTGTQDGRTQLWVRWCYRAHQRPWRNREQQAYSPSGTIQMTQSGPLQGNDYSFKLGQIYMNNPTCQSTNRLPKPKHILRGSLRLAVSLSTCSMNRSGLNLWGSGYSCSSRSIALPRSRVRLVSGTRNETIPNICEDLTSFVNRGACQVYS